MEFDIKSILDFSTKYLKDKSLSPRLDAEMLLCFVISKKRNWIYSHLDFKVDEKTFERYRSLIEKRSQGVPIAYLTGKKEFMGLEFDINENVLVPRPETEELVEKVIKDAKIEGWKKFLDFGTGSGAIAISIAKFLPDAHVWIKDINAEAIKLALFNAKKLGVYERIHISEENEFDAVVSNPPYLTIDEWKSSDLHEPYEALVGGESGNEIYIDVLKNYKACRFYFEIAHPFRKSLKEIFERFGRYEILKDISGRDRIAIIYIFGKG